MVDYLTLRSITTVQVINSSSMTFKNGSTMNINKLNRSVLYNRNKKNNNHSIKKIKDKDVLYTDDLRNVLPKYYDKSNKPVKKGSSKDFVFFKYSTNNGNIDDDSEKGDLESEEQSSSSSSEESESEDLLLKEIELLFENDYSYTDIEKMFPKFYKDNKSKINFLYTQVLEERFKRDLTLEVQKNIDVYRCRQEQINIIKERRHLRKTNRKNKKDDKRFQYNSDTHSNKHFKSKKDFESAINDEIKKVEEECEGQKKFRDNSDYSEDEEEFIIIEHKPDPLTVINTPIQDNLVPVETQPVVKHRRILRDDD
jgi:hypothetical protein